MKYPIVWPTTDPIIRNNFLKTGIDLYEEKFGALSQDKNNPLSRVCVANSCFSLEPVRGCPLSCAYCVATNECSNMNIANDDYSLSLDKINPTKISPQKIEVIFSGLSLVKALVAHPAFIKDKSIITVAAGSSEAFLPVAEEETWEIMKFLANNDYKNPLWFIVKKGITQDNIEKWLDRFSYILDKKIPIIYSVTYSGMPKWVEPYQSNRFEQVDRIKRIGVKVTHHFRPIIRNINDQPDNIENVLNEVLKYDIDAICTGGLRLDPGIIINWKYLKKYDENLLPDVKKVSKGIKAKKKFSPKIVEQIQDKLKRSNKHIPVFSKSSQMLANLLGISDFNLYKYRGKNDNNLELIVPLKIQQKVSNNTGKNFIDVLNSIVSGIGLSMQFKNNKNCFFIENQLHYQEKVAIIHAIGHSNIL